MTIGLKDGKHFWHYDNGKNGNWPNDNWPKRSQKMWHCDYQIKYNWPNDKCPLRGQKLSALLIETKQLYK
jgi:hypothetical protein